MRQRHSWICSPTPTPPRQKSTTQFGDGVPNIAQIHFEAPPWGHRDALGSVEGTYSVQVRGKGHRRCPVPARAHLGLAHSRSVDFRGPAGTEPTCCRLQVIKVRVVPPRGKENPVPEVLDAGEGLRGQDSCLLLPAQVGQGAEGSETQARLDVGGLGPAHLSFTARRCEANDRLPCACQHQRPLRQDHAAFANAEPRAGSAPRFIPNDDAERWFYLPPPPDCASSRSGGKEGAWRWCSSTLLGRGS